MAYARFAAPLLLAFAAAAQAPLPQLRIEPTTGGSIFFVKNTSQQPLTAYLIELVNYPGSSYSLWQDDLAEPIAPGAEKRIQVANMTVGAVPDYVKLQAAIFADGSKSGIPEKAAQIVERRRAVLETTRELLKRIGNGPNKSGVAADLKQWSGSLPAIPRAQRNSQGAINQAAVKSLIADTVKRLDTQSLSEVVAWLHESEKLLAASQPTL
jgi:hypothetical protein